MYLFGWSVCRHQFNFDPTRATVHIQVNDINEYSPVFKEKSYKATVIEGKKYDSILKVEAVDADCSFQFSQICSYEIVTPDVPFTVDKDGKDPDVASQPCRLPKNKLLKNRSELRFLLT